MKRREPGVYAYRTWRHHNPSRAEWGYVGKARNLTTRGKCHLAQCHHQSCRAGGPKPWADLIIRRYPIHLPWWLGWDWMTLSLETLVILALRPRYNWQKNPWPHKVGPRDQVRQRAERETRPSGYRVKVSLVRAGHLALRAVGMLLILGGLTGWIYTR